MFRPVMAIIRFLQRLRRVYISVRGRVDQHALTQIYRHFLIAVETWWWPLLAETCSFITRIQHISKQVAFDYTFSLSLVTHTTGVTHLKVMVGVCHCFGGS